MDMKGFENPSKEFRPAPFWSWNAELSHKELERQIKDMAAKGWGGYFMHSRVGLITPYLSDEWHSLIKTCAKAARKTDTMAWLYDEDKWPSGFAGGIVPETKEDFRMKALRAVPPSEYDAALYRILKECTVDGRRVLLCQYTTPLGDPWFNFASYTDMMNKEAVNKFLEVTVDGYKKEAGEYFGKEIPGIFTDEPCYLMFRAAGPAGLLPWTTDLPVEFKKRKGYDLIENLEKLFFDISGYRRVRFDFFDTATQLFLERFSKNYHDKCAANKLKLTGHYMAEDTLTDQTKWIGAAMPHYEHMDWPGIDKLSRHVNQTVTVKQLTSATDQLGKERAFCEVFGCAGQHFVFHGRQWIHNWEAALGVNFVNHHLSLYTMAGERKRDFPPNFFYQQPYWPYERHMSDYFGRLNYALTRGKRVVDVLVLHPIGTVWAEYDAAVWGVSGWNAVPIKYDAAFKQLTDLLLAQRLDFHYGDETLMERHGKNSGSELAVGQFKYKYVIVPSSLTWKKNTVRLLKAFYNAGGTVIFAGEVPNYVDMAEPLDFTAEFKKAHKHPVLADAVTKLKSLKKDAISVEDIDLKANAASVFVHERDLGQGKRLVFLTNTHETKTLRAEIRLPFSGAVKALSCETGKELPIPALTANGSTLLRHTFYPGGYILLLVDTKATSVSAAVAAEKPAKTLAINGWKAEALDRNVLRVETIDLVLGGKKVLDKTPVFLAWNDHFYKAKDGTPFEATYHFEVESIPSGKVAAVVELAENLESVMVNGKPVKPSAKRWLDDLAFAEIDITGKLVQGANTLGIKGRKMNNVTGSNTHRRVKPSELPYKSTEIEAVYILGDFLVNNWNDERFAIAKKPANFSPDLTDITRDGYPFYAGIIKASAAFTIKDKLSNAALEFGSVEAPCLEIRVNGKKAGVKLWPPFEADAGKFIRKGKNSVEILFPTDLYNLMGPNCISTGMPLGTAPGTFRSTEGWTPRLNLLRKGIRDIRLSY